MSRNSRKRQKERSFSTRRVEALNDALLNNGKAIEEGARKKTWSTHDLKNISPLTDRQREMMDAYIDGNHMCGYGSAGTGKTLMAVYLAMLNILEKTSSFEKLIIVRSIVSTRDPGFLKGSLEEKAAPHEVAYHGIFKTLFGKPSTYQDMKDAGLVEFHTTSFVRSVTWDNAIIILDEAQNTTLDEFDSVVTRTGSKSIVYILGDLRQNDISGSKKESSGFAQALQVLAQHGEFSLIRFTSDDIVRSRFVKKWIMAREFLKL